MSVALLVSLNKPFDVLCWPEPHKNHLKAPSNHPSTSPEAPKSFSKIIPAMAHELVSVAYQESSNEPLEVSTFV